MSIICSCTQECYAKIASTEFCKTYMRAFIYNHVMYLIHKSAHICTYALSKKFVIKFMIVIKILLIVLSTFNFYI